LKQLVVLVVPRRPGWKLPRQGNERTPDLFSRQSAEALAAQWRAGRAPAALKPLPAPSNPA
jgi:hypothetical protein